MNRMASFLDRSFAFIIDLLIISLLISVICSGISNDTELTTRISELETKLVSGEVMSDEIMEEYTDLIYDSQKSMILTSSINIALYFAYFVVFQFMNNGQTFGKKLLKLKIVSSDDGNVSMLRMLIRYLFIVNIFSGLFNIILLFVLPKNIYLMTYLSLTSIESIFMIMSLLFVLYRKDKRGLHDLMAKTKVIKEV